MDGDVAGELMPPASPSRNGQAGAALPPPCPKCRDRSFVRQERLVSTDRKDSALFWLCASCLSMWPVEADPAD